MFYPAGGADCFYRLLTTSVKFCYSFGTFCISFELYTGSEYLNNVFRMLGSTKHLYAQCLTYALRSNNVKFNQTFIQPNPNVPETFFVSWVFVFQGNGKNGRVFKVLQAVDSRAIWMYLARYCNEGHEISHVHSQTYYLAACQVSARSL